MKRAVSYLALLTFVLMRCLVFSEGQQSEVLDNDTVRALVGAGLNASIIISKIKASKCNFDVSTAELLRLKKEKIPDEVIDAMVQAAQLQQATSTSEHAITDPNDPAKPHPAGIYYQDEKGQLVKIFPSVYSQTKSGGFFKSAMTFGVAKIKSKAVVAGAKARLQLTTPRPSFYFYFENTESGLSNSGGMMGVSQPAVSPNEFVLVKTEIKKNSRELVVGQINAFGAQSGTLDKLVRPFDYEDIAPGIFKVTPASDLENGEYCFFYGGSTAMPSYGFFNVGSGGKVFDFGISRSNQKK